MRKITLSTCVRYACAWFVGTNGRGLILVDAWPEVLQNLPSPCQMRYHRSENPGVGARGTGHRMHSQALFMP